MGERKDAIRDFARADRFLGKREANKQKKPLSHCRVQQWERGSRAVQDDRFTGEKRSKKKAPLPLQSTAVGEGQSVSKGRTSLPARSKSLIASFLSPNRADRELVGLGEVAKSALNKVPQKAVSARRVSDRIFPLSQSGRQRARWVR